MCVCLPPARTVSEHLAPAPTVSTQPTKRGPRHRQKGEKSTHFVCTHFVFFLSALVVPKSVLEQMTQVTSACCCSCCCWNRRNRVGNQESKCAVYACPWILTDEGRQKAAKSTNRRQQGHSWKKRKKACNRFVVCFFFFLLQPKLGR